MSAREPRLSAGGAKRRRPLRYVAGAIDEIPPGARKLVTLGGRSVGVFNVEGVYFAVRNRCPHQGGPLCLGQLTQLTRPIFHENLPPEIELDPEQPLIRCPWHAWEFDLRTGEAVVGGGVHVATYKAYVQEHPEMDPDVRYIEQLEIPPPVETYRAAIEAGYVVVEVGS